MAARQDIQLVDNDLLFVNGDLVIGDSDQQHIQDTITAFPGWWKENPGDGVGAMSYLNSTGQEQGLARAIKIQLGADGYKVNSPKISFIDGKLIIDPDVKNI